MLLNSRSDAILSAMSPARLGIWLAVCNTSFSLLAFAHQSNRLIRSGRDRHPRLTSSKRSFRRVPDCCAHAEESIAAGMLLQGTDPFIGVATMVAQPKSKPAKSQPPVLDPQRVDWTRRQLRKLVLEIVQLAK